MLIQYFTHREGKLVTSRHVNGAQERKILTDYESQEFGRDPLEILIEAESELEIDYEYQDSTRG